MSHGAAITREVRTGDSRPAPTATPVSGRLAADLDALQVGHQAAGVRLPQAQPARETNTPSWAVPANGVTSGVAGGTAVVTSHIRWSALPVTVRRVTERS